MHLTITLIWNKYSISVELIRILPTYVPLGEMQIPLISIFKARSKFYGFFLDEKCASAVCLMCWVAENTLLQCEESVLYVTVYKLAKPLGMPQSCFTLKTIPTPCRAKISKSQIQKGNRLLTYLFYIPVSIRNSETLFFETPFHWSFGTESTTQHCWSLLCPVGHEDKEPRRHDLKLKNMLFLFSSLCKDITFVPILNPAKSSPTCKSETEDVICFAANIMFMAKLQVVM